MKLTQADKLAFVRAVMADIPSTDYTKQAQVAIQKDFYKRMPTAVKALFGGPPDDQMWLRQRNLWLNNTLGSVCVFADVQELSEAMVRFIEGITAQALKQKADRADISTAISGAINACNTLKQAQERLPEFAKYLPKERVPQVTKNLPATNLIADMRRAGWKG